MSNKYSRLKNSSISKEEIEKLEKDQQDKEILSLLSSSVSVNWISQHFKSTQNKDILPHAIRKTLIQYADRIDDLNEKFDKIATKIIFILEMDETFKGMGQKILVVMDSVTGYVFSIELIRYKSKKCIINALESLNIDNYQVKLVLTDGAPYFPEVIKKVFPNAKHQICLVHVRRTLNAELRKISLPYRDSKAELKDFIKNRMKNEEKLDKKRAKLKLLKLQAIYWINQRNIWRNRYGVKPYEKNILKKYPKLKEINDKINTIRSQRNSLEKTINRTITEIKMMDALIILKTKAVNTEWNLYMKEAKILHEFNDLFYYSNKKYVERKERFLMKLAKEKKNSLRKKIIDLLKKVPGLDAVNRDDSIYPLKRNFQNTNGIESFNSRFRPILDSMRNLKDSAFSRTRFQLFRLYINTTKPFNPTRSNCSPIENYGYNLRGKSTVELIVDGLPPGPQFDLFLPDAISELKARKFKKIKVFS